MEPEMILPLMIVGVCVLFIVIVPIVAKKEQKNAIDQMDEEPQEIPEPEIVGARVIKKRVSGAHSGGKVSRYSLHFCATFMTDDGEELEFEIPQELFDRISEDQLGSLVTINGNFIDFGDGEDVAEEKESI